MSDAPLGVQAFSDASQKRICLSTLLRSVAKFELPNLLSLALIVLIVGAYLSPFADLDFSWQVLTGKQIVETGSLRVTDLFSYTIAGERLPDFEWLYEVALWIVWRAFGVAGLKLLKLLLVAAPLVVLGLRLRREGVRGRGVVLAIGIAVVVLAPAWNLRPLYGTTLGLLLVSGWLHDHCTGRRPLPWALPVVMLLWANLHPGVITGQGLLAGALTWEWINRRVRLNTPLPTEALRRLTLIGGLGLALTFVCPDPIERLRYTFKPELAHPIWRIFGEMNPTYVFVMRPPFVMGLVYVAAALVLLSVVLRFRQYRLWEIALLCGAGGLANLAFRSLQDWLLLMLAFGVPHLAILLRQAARSRRQWFAAALLRLDRSCKRLLHGWAFRFQWHWPAAVAGLLAVVSLTPLAARVPERDGPGWPRQAVDWIEANHVEGRFFGPPDYGAYLVWRLPGRARSYVDTRGFFFPPQLVEDSHYLPCLDPGWEQRVERVLARGTDYFLLETTGPRGALWRALQGQVEPVYWDTQTVLVRAEQVRDGLRPGANARHVLFSQHASAK